jgi:hypothetical protein
MTRNILATAAVLCFVSGRSLAAAPCDPVVFDFFEEFGFATTPVACESIIAITGLSGGVEIPGSIYQHPPLSTAPASCKLRWSAVTIPQVGPGEAVLFESRVGLADSALDPTGVGMRVNVGPLTKFLLVKDRWWLPFTLDVTSLAGQTVAVELEVSNAGNSNWDHAF